MFENAPKGSKFYNSSSTDIERQLTKIKEKIACCTPGDFSEVVTIETSAATTTVDVFPTLAAFANKYIRLVSTGVAGTKTIAIPLDSTIDFPIGTEFTFFWATPVPVGADLYTITVANPATTFNFFSPTLSPGAATATFAGTEHTAITIKKVGVNAWDGVGNIV